MKRRAFQLSLAAAAIGFSTSALAQAKWDLATAYPATNFHTVNISQFAADVDKASGGKLKITVHANAALFKAPEIKRAVQGDQAQAGEILLVNYQNEWQVFGADGLPFVADSYDEAAKLWKVQRPVLEKKLAEQQARLLEAQRTKNLQRMAGLAGASGSATSSGSALQSAGPSASYAGRIRARIKPNIVFTEDISGNPTALVEVRTSPDGTIISRKLTQSSGVKAWDEAVLRAIDKTEVLPRDTDGRVPSPLLISFRPKD